MIEADEYDTAFFDKRSKFVHYRPRTAILNNLEFDHADIFPDLAAIETQFHHLVRTVPGDGPDGRQRRARRACSACSRAAAGARCSASARAGCERGPLRARGEPHAFDVLARRRRKAARVEWPLLGEHNQLNALAAIAAAEHVGVPVAAAARALASFRGRRRRMELRGARATAIAVYDDFAHHPTAIAHDDRRTAPPRSARRASSRCSSRAPTR